MEQFPAHMLVDSNGGERVQTTEEHNRAVADYAAGLLAPVGLSKAGELCGLLHDIGKLTGKFRAYITRAAHGEPVRRGEVNHTFSAVRLLFERYHKAAGPPMRNMTCEILAFATGAHHGQFDCIDPDGRDGFTHRLTAENVDYEEARSNLSARLDLAELDKLFEAAVSEVTQIVSLCQGVSKGQGETLFCLSLLCRLLLSALIDGDRRDAAEFELNTRFPVQPEDMGPVWEARLAALEQRLDEIPSRYPVDRARKLISRQCGCPAPEREGVYRLSVPTGSGKTLSSLRFALATAAAHRKRRIIFVSPLLSIIEQNSAVVRDYINDDGLILEHHSNVVRTKNEDIGELDTGELLTETWNAPIVITTFVQLLNTLFDGGTGCVRRMSALADSVIVIDEIQALPIQMTSQFNLAINFLTAVCHSTVLLCSATQPCLEQVKHPMRIRPPELVPYDPDLWKVFRRTEIIDRRVPGGYTAEELAGLAISLLPDRGSVLLICNKKEQALQLYRNLSHAPARVFHLSTSMCMAHRLAVFEKIKTCLGREPVICVATQLVESGVDLSFGCVIRVVAGMDNIVQAAGRCNRNGTAAGPAPVYIVRFQGENLSKLADIRRSQDAAENLLESFKQDPSRFGGDLQSEPSVAYFYKRLFDAARTEQDYPVSKRSTSFYEMLSTNAQFRGHCHTAPARAIGQAFKTAGQFFKVFDDSTEDVLVPYGRGEDLIAGFCSERAKHDLAYRIELLRLARRYSVSLFSYQLRQLQENGGVRSLYDDTIRIVQPGFYSDEFGIELTGDSILMKGVFA